jgi:hypothetical protein
MTVLITMTKDRVVREREQRWKGFWLDKDGGELDIHKWISVANQMKNQRTGICGLGTTVEAKRLVTIRPLHRDANREAIFEYIIFMMDQYFLFRNLIYISKERRGLLDSSFYGQSLITTVTCLHRIRYSSHSKEIVFGLRTRSDSHQTLS